MINSIDEFNHAWKNASESTVKLLSVLTDASLSQLVAEGHWTLGRIAWHIIQSIPEMANRTGLEVGGPAETDPVPTSADEILGAYETASSSLAEQVSSQWTDETLLQEDEMYGEKWKRCMTLSILMIHEVHHRGQMTVLMRQAGLKVPGIYGPSKEEWEQFGMKPPEM
jgi:uncharacterized damage-inducible protein DinB